jgi:hypothetical protein
MIKYQGNINQSKLEKVSSTYAGNDPFFTKNYDHRIFKNVKTSY